MKGLVVPENSILMENDEMEKIEGGGFLSSCNSGFSISTSISASISSSFSFSLPSFSLGSLCSTGSSSSGSSSSGSSNSSSSSLCRPTQVSCTPRRTKCFTSFCR